MTSKTFTAILTTCILLSSGCNSTFITRSYAIPRSAFKTLVENPNAKPGVESRLVEKQGAPIVDTEIQRFFEQCGVTFPKGAYIKYDERREALTIRNTPKNIERAEGVMTSSDGSKPPQL